MSDAIRNAMGDACSAPPIFFTISLAPRGNRLARDGTLRLPIEAALELRIVPLFEGNWEVHVRPVDATLEVRTSGKHRFGSPPVRANEATQISEPVRGEEQTEGTLLK